VRISPRPKRTITATVLPYKTTHSIAS
jgi:hypothetical protein